MGTEARPAANRRVVIVALMVAWVLVVGACADDDPESTSTPLSADERSTAPRGGPATSDPAVSTTLPPVDGPFAPGRTQVPGFGEVEVRVVPGPDGEPVVLCVLAAETDGQRRRGLMEVTDPELGGYDGMLFTYPADVTGGFWMKDTRIPLSIAYLDADGAVVDAIDMEPCPEAVEAGTGCPSHPPSAPFRRALEVPRGRLARLGLVPGPARLEVAGACRPTRG